VKKIIALIAMLLLTTLSYAAESDPSETVGFVRYTCVANPDNTDMNFVALPMNAGYSTAQDLGNAMGADYCTSVNAWDDSTQTWSGIDWLEFIQSWSGDFNLESGHAYMINVVADADLYIAGSLPVDPVYDLVTNADSTYMNFIMLPLSMSYLTDAQALGNDIGTEFCTSVNTWDTSTQTWSGIDWLESSGTWSGNFDIEIGMPLMVNIISNTTWPSPDKAVDVKPFIFQQSDKNISKQ